jgi:aspartate/glutamate racemase
MKPVRVALIHATALAVTPIQQAFARHWPQANCMNVLDDSLSRDRAQDGELTPAMVQRFIDLAQYVQRAGCQGILFTCSACGPAIEAAGRATGLPTLKPNEAMFEQALALPAPTGVLRLGLVATFEASIPSMSEEFEALAAKRGVKVVLHSVFVPQAMADLAAGQADLHHERIAKALSELPECDGIMLAQFSMAAAQPVCQQHARVPVLSSPDCAVTALQQAMHHV